jgi:hypothetical protein
MLKILHIRRSGSDVEGPTRASRGNSFGNWDLDSDDLGADPDPDVMAKGFATVDQKTGHPTEEQRIGGKPPSITHWAFGPDRLPTLQVLAFRDFFYDGRLYIHNHLICRYTWSIRNPENDISQQGKDELILTFRPVRPNDRELWDLIDRNTEFFGACPTDSIVTD